MVGFPSFRHLDGTGSHNYTSSFYNLCSTFFYRSSDTGTEGFYHLLLPAHHLCHVKRNIVCVNTELPSFLGVEIVLGRIQQGLGGNAAHVQAGSTHVLLLNHQHLLATMTESFCRQIAAWSTTDYNHIKHSSPPYRAIQMSMSATASQRAFRNLAAGAPSTAA